jgi:hypothetical protein
MTQRLYDSCIPSPTETVTDGFTNDDPPPKRWYLMGENFSAARRALYAARAQLG